MYIWSYFRNLVIENAWYMLLSSKTVQKVNNCSIIDLKTLKCSKKKRINKLTPTSRQLLSHMINVDFFSYRNMHLYRVDCSRSLKLQVFRYVLAAVARSYMPWLITLISFCGRPRFEGDRLFWLRLMLIRHPGICNDFNSLCHMCIGFVCQLWHFFSPFSVYLLYRDVFFPGTTSPLSIKFIQYPFIMNKLDI